MSAKKLPPILTVKEILRLYKIQARKNLSQNFLLDMNMVRKIVRSASFIKDHHVVEVGPGPGGITQALLQTNCKHLTVIEKDSRFMPALKRFGVSVECIGIDAATFEMSRYMLADEDKSSICVQTYLEKSETGTTLSLSRYFIFQMFSLEMLGTVYENMDIIHGDILKFDMERLFPEELKTPWASKPPPIHIIGNLPFNVSTPLIIRWLRDISYQRGAWSYGRTRLTLTFQKEVAERMVAPIASDERCRLSMMCQHLCNVKLNFIIPGKVFVPAPEVDVGVVSFVPLIEPKIKLPFELVEKVMRHVFHHRNKKCRYGIRTLFPKEHWYFAEEILEKSAINPIVPSYKLSMEELDKICHAYNDICKTVPGIISYDYRATPVERIVKEQEITSLILAQDHI